MWDILAPGIHVNATWHTPAPGIHVNATWHTPATPTPQTKFTHSLQWHYKMAVTKQGELL